MAFSATCFRRVCHTPKAGVSLNAGLESQGVYKSSIRFRVRLDKVSLSLPTIADNDARLAEPLPCMQCPALTAGGDVCRGNTDTACAQFCVHFESSCEQCIIVPPPPPSYSCRYRGVGDLEHDIQRRSQGGGLRAAGTVAQPKRQTNRKTSRQVIHQRVSNRQQAARQQTARSAGSQSARKTTARLRPVLTRSARLQSGSALQHWSLTDR